MGERFFDTPDLDRAKKSLEEEEKRGGAWNASFYKPKPGVENVIRILPAPAGSGADWHIKVAKHFIKHGQNDNESFVCMKEMYGKPCPACEEFHKLQKNDPARANFSYRRSGVFNIIDRLEYQAWLASGKKSDLFPKVKLYEAPVQAVWYTIVQLVSAKGRQSHIFDEYDENGNVKVPGRDWIIYFNPNLDPQSMYRLIPSDPCPLGTPEEIKLWIPQIIPLIPEKIPFYTQIEYEEAAIKTFGTPEERKLLKESKKAAAQAAAPKKEEERGYPAELDETSAGAPEEGSDGMGEAAPEAEGPSPEELAAIEAQKKAEEAAKKAADAKAAKAAQKAAPKPAAPKPETPKPEPPKPAAPAPPAAAEPEKPSNPGAPTAEPAKQTSLAEIQAKIAGVRAKYAKK